MRIRILKSIASIYGGFAPGMVVDIPNEAIAKSWCNAGIAEETKAGLSAEARQIIPHKFTKEKPDVIPKGMLWCDKHQTLHKTDSSTGKKCLRRIEAEQKKAEEAEEEARREAEEAEEKARQEAEAEAEQGKLEEPQ